MFMYTEVAQVDQNGVEKYRNAPVTTSQKVM